MGGAEGPGAQEIKEIKFLNDQHFQMGGAEGPEPNK